MKTPQRTTTSTAGQPIEKRLAAYLTAAGAVGTVMASDAQAIIVFNQTPQPIGINGAVPIDFNGDGQIDYEIDHDRVDLGGGNFVDYLQLDKNDINGANLGENLFPTDVFATFPLNGTMANDTFNAKYVTNTNLAGSYPAALEQNALIGPGSNLDWQEGDSFEGSGKTIRANRLIDEDATTLDQVVGGLTPAQVQVPFDGPNFIGLAAGEVRYLGVQMDFENTNFDHYGWIGIRIDNEADATATVVGWGYETTPFTAIRAGQIPEPGSIVMAALGGLTLVGVAFVRWLRSK
ncbi:MAG: hypothetical protein WD851_23230 [Pirellulales bacterium]